MSLYAFSLALNGPGVYGFSLALVIGLFLFDFQNVLGWWRGRTLSPHPNRRDFDFTIVVPVYGHRRYFDDREHLLGYRENVLVTLDIGAPGMAEFGDELEEEGWRVARVQTANPNPPNLIAAALDRVETAYMVRVDADTRIVDDLPRYIAAMAEDGADVCSAKVLVRAARSIPARFQALEYRMAMLSRHYRPWLTSGACTIASLEAWRTIVANHSMWFPGEDIETGRVALALKLRVRHLDMRAETDVPDTWSGLFRQRRLWWAGNFRHLIVNFDKNALQLPVVTFYYAALVYVGLYFKWWTLIGYLHPFVLVQTLISIFVVYAIITVVSNLKIASWGMLVFPPYALVQAILMPIVGAIWYLVLARRQGFLGRYQIGYRKRAVAIQPRTAP